MAMINHTFRRSAKNWIIVGAALATTLAGCVVGRPGDRSGYRGRPAVQAQASVSFQDDYDYYPGYETYYSRNRHEFVYRDGNAWVRRPQPAGVSMSVLLAAPSVRMDFHDSPEQHQSAVVRQYPRNWKRPDVKPDGKDDRKDDRDNGNKDRRDDDRKDDDKRQ